MIERDQAEIEQSLVEMAAMEAAISTSIPLESIVRGSSIFTKNLKAFHPVKLAATFGSFLTQKRLQKNCLRLEILVHLSAAVGKGTRAPTTSILTQGYSSVGNVCGCLEDPPEDIFVGNISSKNGNYRVLEGIWESGTFYLQRFVNLADDLPDTEYFKAIARSIHALLKVSEIVCARAGLTRNDLGNQRGENSLPRKLTDKSSELRRLVQFSLEELVAAEIDIDDLTPFIFDPSERKTLLTQSITNSSLEAHPLAFDDDRLYLLLPTAVSIAIRRFLLEKLGSGDNREFFLYQLGLEYSQVLKETPMFGKRSRDLPFTHTSWGSLCCISRQIDAGRFLNLIFFMDTLDEFDHHRFSGINAGNEKLLHELVRAIHGMEDSVSKQQGFRDGITMLIGCGIGRGISLPIKLERKENWKFEFLSAPDYCTLSKVRKMQPLNLWRVLEMRRHLEQMNVWLQNMNGFLNLYAWAISLDGHLVPHADVPIESNSVNSLYLPILQNSLLDLRYKVVSSIDHHVEKFIDGTWRSVMTEGLSHFEEDNNNPLYGHISTRIDESPLGACITANRCWWYDLVSPLNATSTISFDRWKMIGTWLQRAVNPLEDVFGKKLGKEPILWRCVFELPQNTECIEELGMTEDLADVFRTNVDVNGRTVELYIGAGFDRAIYHPENIAEKALVQAFVNGIAQLAKDHTTDLDKTVNTIVPNTRARHSHMFPALTFRDYMHEVLEEEPITISKFDDAAIKLGMGWRVRHRGEGGQVEGSDECLSFLNALVQHLENELCMLLRSFNRTALLNKLLFNSELASASKEKWHRTASAIIALRTDRSATLEVMQKFEQKLNAVFQSTRIVVEMALCESPIDGLLVPGDLDISKLLTKGSQLFHLGGWSDLIRWELLEPLLVIRPLGDVHAKQDIIETIIDAFGNATSENRYMSSVRNYPKSLEKPQVFSTSNGKIDVQFLRAWLDEFGVEIDAYRRFIDNVENCAIDQKQPIIHMHQSGLIALADSKEIGLKIIENLSIIPRSSWRDVPHDYDNRDIAPWRFRRRLSLVRRPLVQLTNDNDPLMIVVPGMLRESFAYIVGNYYYAFYPDWHLGPAMKKYAGYARKRDGLQFNQEVTNRMIELGWQTQTEVTLTKILGKALERNFGDVDVLAWDAKNGRILVMECKDLQFRKTYGEIAEQLADFRGETSQDGKRRDQLRKHLDRIEVLTNNPQALKKYLNLVKEIKIESIIVFRNPVPMQFSNGSIRQHAQLFTFSDLHKLKCLN